MFKFSKRSVAITAAVFTIAGSGAALAYWTTTGAGTGTAATGSVTGITVHQTSTVSGLTPGGTPVALAGDFTNTNASAVTIASVTASVTGTSNAGCSAGDFAIGGNSTNPGSIPVGSHVGAWSGLTVALTETGVNQNACQNATITITYAAS